MSFFAEIQTGIEIDGDTDEIRVSYPAEYRFSPEKQLIEYEEQAEDGIVHSRITVTKEAVDIERDSAAMPCLHLREGETTERSIETLYGSIPLTCRCERTLSKLDEHGGRIHLRYTLDIGGGESHNRVNIKVFERPSDLR